MESNSASKLLFLIHDVSPWGGQDKVTLELARRFSQKLPTEVCAFSSSEENAFKLRLLWPNLKRPVLLKSIFYHCYTYIFIQKGRGKFLHASGACALRSDGIQVHFVHKAWQKRNRLTGNVRKGMIKKGYRFVLDLYDLGSEKLAFRSHKSYFPVSQRVKEELKTHYPYLKHIEVVYPGVDTSQFRPAVDEERASMIDLQKKYGIVKGSAVILFVGSFERKGLAVLINALAKLQLDNFTLLVIGEGKQEKYLRLAEDSGFANSVHFLGRQTNLVPFYQLSDLFVLPTQYEPFGMVVLEAMACGVVPVVSQIAGVAELIEDGKNGRIIANENNAHDLGELLDKLLTLKETQKEKFTEMGKNARETAEKYAWANVFDRYQGALSRAWGRKRK